MRDSDNRFAETEFVVKATSFEQFVLWEKHSKRISWQQDTCGFSAVVGDVGGCPVCVAFSWARLNGHLVLFYDATSRVVDHDMVAKWIKKRCLPKWDRGTREAFTDANNFHHVISAFNEGVKAA